MNMKWLQPPSSKLPGHQWGSVNLYHDKNALIFLQNDPTKQHRIYFV